MTGDLVPEWLINEQAQLCRYGIRGFPSSGRLYQVAPLPIDGEQYLLNHINTFRTYN